MTDTKPPINLPAPPPLNGIPAKYSPASAVSPSKEPGVPIIVVGAAAPPSAARNSPQRPFPGMNPQQQNGNVRDNKTPPNKPGQGKQFNKQNAGNGRGFGSFKGNTPQQQGGGDSAPASSSPQKDRAPRKQDSNARLFVGNLTKDTTEDDLRKLFAKFIADPEIFLDKVKMFAFIRLDTEENARIARKEMDGTTLRGRIIRVRLAPSSVSLRIKNLGQNVSNELLKRAFDRFGEIEKATVNVDDRGRPTGEGLVVFARKNNAMEALKNISDGVFLLGVSPRPIHVELLEQKDADDGLPEVHVSSRQTYQQETMEPPHFARAGSLEFEFGQRWKRLFDNHHKKAEELDKMFRDACATLEKEMETSVQDLEMNKLRQAIMEQQLKLQQMEQKKVQHIRGGPAGNMLLAGLGGSGAPLPPPGFAAQLQAGLGNESENSPGFMEHVPLLPQGPHMMMPPGAGGGQGRNPQPFGLPFPGGPPNFIPGPPRFGQPDQFEMAGLGERSGGAGQGGPPGGRASFEGNKRGQYYNNNDQKRQRN